MLDPASIRVYKYLATHSSNNNYKDSFSEIARVTGLSGKEVLRALSVLEEENYIQIIHPLESLEKLFPQIARNIINREREYIESFRGVKKFPIEGSRKLIEKEKTFAIKLFEGTEFQDILEVDIIDVIEELEKVNHAFKKLFSTFVEIKPLVDSYSSLRMINSIKYSKRLLKTVESLRELNDEDIASLSAVLSVFLEIPIRRKALKTTATLQTMQNLRELEQSLEEIEAQIMIEGPLPELVELKNQLKNEIEELSKLVSSQNEQEVFFIEKHDLSRLQEAITFKETFLRSMDEFLKNMYHPNGEEIRNLLTDEIELIKILHDIIKKIEEKYPKND
jgi:DNA-binding Lrp family transcriptional regulator